MDAQARDILASLDARDPKFRAQVDAFRSFRQQIRDAGVVVESEGYTVALMDRIAPPHEQTVALFEGLAVSR